MSTTKYVITWECKGCGTSGEIVGEDLHDAWRQFEPVREYHTSKHNVFYHDEGYAEEQR